MGRATHSLLAKPRAQTSHGQNQSIFRLGPARHSVEMASQVSSLAPFHLCSSTAALSFFRTILTPTHCMPSSPLPVGRTLTDLLYWTSPSSLVPSSVQAFPA